ncbi:MAG: helix-turn-helix domain-containing protein, partial [Rickettsiales bacterium]|nr:helix-turn-helix domain-containing protein [Rickettsiales bacterium]
NSTNIGDMMKVSQPKSLFGLRLREARLRVGIPQDKLGVMIGLDEASASARISRYESGIHAPPFELVEQMASVLKLPAAYFYCSDDRLAEIMQMYLGASNDKREYLLKCAKNL